MPVEFSLTLSNISLFELSRVAVDAWVPWCLLDQGLTWKCCLEGLPTCGTAHIYPCTLVIIIKHHIENPIVSVRGIEGREWLLIFI